MKKPTQDTPRRFPLRVPETRLYQRSKEVVQVLHAGGYQAYIVGGAIRDLAMGAQPSDFDLTTDALPEQVTALFAKTLPVGIEFGTVIVLQEDDPFEVTTFRTDGQYLDGRRPESVVFGSVVEDVTRRDFTINGLLYDPLSEEVIDYVGGMEHIQARVITTIGDPLDRFTEDKLRMLRAVRFVSKLGFSIERETLEAIRKMASGVSAVSVERIQQELFKLLQGKYVAQGCRDMVRSGLLAEIVPVPLEDEALLRRMERLQGLEQRSLNVSLSTLLAPLSKSEIESVLRHWKCSNQVRKQCTELLEHLANLKDYAAFSVADRKRWLRKPEREEAGQLARVLDEGGSLVGPWERALEDCARWSQEDLSPVPLLTGNELKGLGFKAGPLFKKILLALETEQLEGRLHTREEAQRWLLSAFSEHVEA